MNDDTPRGHPDVETLDVFRRGAMSEPHEEETRRHVDSCVECRLELKRLSRFEEIEADDELARDADWQAARVSLERVFDEHVLPEVVDRERPARGEIDGRPFRSRWQIRWLAPVAAAAAATLLVVTQVGKGPSDDLGPMRGPDVESSGIVIVEPTGEIEEAPKQFTWEAKTENDYYTLEVFTAGLENVYTEDEIPQSHWSATDSLRSLLARDTIYLWNVTGHKGLERETVSPNGWFKITDGDS
jgi:hypothetical protein